MIILLVEDEALIAMTLEAALADAGHQVLGPVSTAHRALELAGRTHPDLALLDVDLRHGGSGIDLARDLLRRWGTPVLFVSGQIIEARANKDAALGFIGKPYNPQTVLASIEVVKAITAGLAYPPPDVPRELEIFDKDMRAHNRV